MIIKRWNGSAFVKEFPQTQAQLVRNAGDTESVFDSFDKIKPAYLPNSVFDSLYFSTNATPGATKLRAVDAIRDGNSLARSPLGFYWVVSTAGNLTASNTATVEALYTLACTYNTLGGVITTADTSNLRIGMIVNGANIPTNSVITAIDQNGTSFTINATPTLGGSGVSLSFSYSIATFITSGEEREVGSTVTTVGLEIGDWFVISKVTGVGSIASPYNITFAIINNTYELMGGAGASTAGYSGLVPGAASGQNLHFLRGDGTWVIPTNTTYTGSTSITLNGTSFERAALTGDVTASANSNATTIAADSVTFAKMQNIATSTILGRVSASTGDVEALTAAQVRTLINVADGATAYAHPTQTAIDANATDDGINVIDRVQVNTSGHVTAVTTRNLSAATTSLPGHMTAADKTKLDGIATGAQVNVATNLAQGTRTTTAVPVTSSTGTSATLDIATTSLAGVMSSADKTKLDGIATGATANSSDATLLARGNHTGTQLASTISDFATAVAATASVTANTAKVTNATHTGDVTGATTLTIASQAVTYAKIQNISATSRVLGRITAGAGSTEELTGANVRSIIELAAPIYVQTATPTTSVTHSLWYDIN